MKVLVTEDRLGKALVEVLGKVELTLADTASSGTLLDFGSGIKQWITKLDTRISRNLDFGNGRYLHYDFYNIRLPVQVKVREVISIQANLAGNDVLVNKTATGKLTGTELRVEYSGNANVLNLSTAQKECTVYVTLTYRERT